MVKVSLALVLLVTACSDDNNADDFVGTWQFDPGAQRVSSCADPIDLSGTLLFVQPGSKSDLMVMSDCQVDLTVDGNIATASNNSCMSNGTSGMSCRTHVVTRSVFPMTLELDGSTLTLAQTWTQIDQDTCGTRTCTGTVTGTLTKSD